MIVDRSKCKSCGFCELVCRSKECVECLACYYSCPFEARKIEEKKKKEEKVTIFFDDLRFEVPKTTVAKALQTIGFKFKDPGNEPSLSCKTGGCWSCALLINGKVERACITPVKDNMKISFGEFEPRRIIHGPEPHLVGGKATPWWEVDYLHYVEAAVWTAGCNLRCPQCQNYTVTYDNFSKALSPKEAAELLAFCHKTYRTKGVAISGGEPTLNRKWLIKFFRELSKITEKRVRRHLDSNGTILTRDYVDELVDAGCNNIGIEPKCVSVETYMKITGLDDKELASKYLENAWKIAKYICDEHSGVYLGIGLVYNSALVSFEEIAEAGEKIAKISGEVQVTVLDYFPAFRRRDLKRPSYEEMIKVRSILEGQGLKNVVVQTVRGHVTPHNRR